MTHRALTRAFTAAPTQDGDGVALRRAFPSSDLLDLDPFLLLDQLGPSVLPPGGARGFPPHPHRGFETVTYLLSGEMEHRDSWGNHGTLAAGDVQWMTAGSGLVHSEMPGKSLLSDGGTLHGFQLWVNLPKRDKMVPPRYQDTLAAHIPVVQHPGSAAAARVIAGETLGARGVIDTRLPILYLHLTLQPGAWFEQPIPRSHNAFAYVIEGTADFDGGRAGKCQLALFDRAGEGIRAGNSGPSALSLLLLAAEPIGEPIARYGPFVMNSKDEIVTAVDDFRNGRMGSLP